MDKKVIRNNKKIVGMIVGVLAFVFLAIGITYAWLTWISDETNISGNTGSFSVTYSKGGNIFNEELLPVESYLDGEKSWVALKKDANGNDGYAEINLNITDVVVKGTCVDTATSNAIEDVTNTYCEATPVWNSETNTCSNSLFTSESDCQNGITVFSTDVNLGFIHYAVYLGDITYSGDNITEVTNSGGIELSSGTLDNCILRDKCTRTFLLHSGISLTDTYQAYIVYIWLDSGAGNEFIGTSITGNISASAANDSMRSVDMSEEMS